MSESVTRKVILYHGNCPDGFGAAWAAWKALGDSAEYVAVNYGQEPPSNLGGADVVIVDFSYPRDVLLSVKERARSVQVLDHHATAEKELIGLDFCTFDMNHSGAALSWTYFHNSPPPDLIRYVEDRDLWRFSLPQSREVSAALWSFPRAFTQWDQFSTSVETLKVDGAAILRFKNELVEQMCSQSTTKEIGGHKVPVVNASVCASEVGEALCKKFPEAAFAAYYFDRADGKRQWGARSTGFDVSVVAKTLGGGGHVKAAGWTE